MKFSEQIEIVYKKSVYLSMSKLYKKISAMSDEQLKSVLNDKSFPDFRTFLNTVVGTRRHFTLTEGIWILNCYTKGTLYYSDKNEHCEEEVERMFHKNTYSLSQLVKKLKNLDNETINEILQNKPFPSINVLIKYLPDKSISKFSLYEGLVLLKCFSCNVQYDLLYVNREEYRLQRAIKQSDNQKNRDMRGLLGVTVPRLNKEKKKTKKTVRSVWTVKK